ncbi:MAG: hypothetical protein H7319_15935 [Spirosoma sp.]|nr:hypothetical protein [Spirosoma sp.]
MKTNKKPTVSQLKRRVSELKKQVKEIDHLWYREQMLNATQKNELDMCRETLVMVVRTNLELQLSNGLLRQIFELKTNEPISGGGVSLLATRWVMDMVAKHSQN